MVPEVKPIDFGRTAHDYSHHRAGFPDAFFDRLGPLSGRWLDLGTGTGTVARGLAQRGCDVTALDRSEALIGEAKRLDTEAGVTVRYVVGDAEDTKLDGGSFDGIVAGQCWHWFDPSRAVPEARRLLRAGGRIVIAHFDWLPLVGNVVAATEALIGSHNPSWTMGGGTGLYPDWLTHLGQSTGDGISSFTRLETFSFDVDIPYSHEGWRGRIRASAGVGASLSPTEVAAFDTEHRRVLGQVSDPLQVPHRVWAALGRRV